MINELLGIKVFFDSSSISSTIIRFEKEDFYLDYYNGPFKKLFRLNQTSESTLRLSTMYLQLGLTEEMIQSQIYLTLKDVLRDKSSKSFKLDRIERGEKVVGGLSLVFTFLMEKEGVVYISHTCEPKSSEAKRKGKEVKLFRHAEDFSNFGFWELDLKDGSLYWSDGVYKIVEIDKGSIVLNQETGTNIIHPEDRAKALEMMQNAISKGAPYKINKRFLLPNGKVKNILSSGSTIFDHSKQPIKLIGVFQDITEKVEEESKLKEFSDNLQMLVNSIDGIIWEADPKTFTFTYVSPQSLKILGYTPEEWLQTPNFWEDHIHPDDKQSAIGLCQKETAACRDHIFEYRMLSKWGTYIWLQDRATVISEDGIPLKIKGVTLDISKEKTLNEDIKLMVNNTDEAFILVNLDLSCRIFNDRFDQLFLKYFGKKIKKGKSVLSYVEEDERASTKIFYDKIFEGKEKKTEYFFEDEQKGRVVFSVEFKPAKNDKDEIIGAFITAKDVTEMERRFKEIQKSEARFRGLYESSTYFIIRTNLKGEYTYVNKKYEDAFGWLYPGETLIGKSTWSTVLEHDIVKVQETGGLALSQPGKVFKVQLEKPEKDGGVIHTLWDFMSVTDENGNPIEIQCMGSDITDRVKFEQELRNSNERFELVMQAGSECIWDFDPNTENMFLGDGFRRNFGLEIKSPEENNAYINEKFHPEDKDWVIKYFRETLKNPEKRQWVSKFRLQNGEGHNMQVEDRAVILRDEKGKPIRAVGAMRDVSHEVFYSQLEMMEKEVMAYAMQVDAELLDVIKLQLGKLEEIFPEMKSSVMRVKNGKLLHLIAPSMPNAYMDEIHGAEIGENVGSCGTAAYLKEKVIVSDIFTDPRWNDFKHLAEKYNFRACWSQPIFNSEGEVVATFANYYEDLKEPSEKEIQAMDRAQRLVSLIMEKFDFIEKIKSSNERFENVTEATNDAIWDFDVANNVLFWAKGFETLFKFDLKKINPSLDFLISRIHEKDRERVLSKIRAFMSDGTSSNWFEEYQFKTGNNRYAYVIDRAKFIRDPDGQVLRVIGAMTDITHLKEYEKSLESLNKSLDQRAKELALSNAELEQFAYIASHDLQEPLRMVTSFLHQLEKKYGELIDERGKKYIHFAVDGAERMRQIILDLLEFSRVGKYSDEMSVFSLEEVGKEVVHLLRKSIEEKDAKITFSNLPKINYFKTPFYQVFKNLIENAIKYSRDGDFPVVKVAGYDQGNEWKISVEDNGIGLEKEYFDKVFVIFQRLHTKEKYSGTGMGLAIVKKIVDGMGGDIWVESTPGNGSVFSFTIPKTLIVPNESRT
ncbi:PAS domain-containing protein [Arthrospiribacter ruber]|uniref:histidine kinase n=1 Tax=Arthrospiribacter ruber TaxID=2487934 RepID=A0A951MFA2_9BACT|nr:PAS domain-containing protein [Arthrospiribacter ruber]MBW3468426.1 PAS domain S-box protein [Arthrospiribacter ruber]